MRIAECGMRNEKQSGIRDANCESSTPNSEQSPPSSVLIGGTPHSNGFTLIEIVIVIVIIGIISTVAAMIIMQAVKMYSDENARTDIHYQAKLAVERMAREIRSARQQSEIGTTVLGTITGNPTNSFIFTDITGTTITYSLTGTTLNRTVGGIPSPLAQGVTTLGFQHYTSASALTTTPASVWLVEINVTDTQGANTLQIRTRVHPRNF
jgi:prepilin-type N-terminal cleavage/methylation domain-containing protein